MPGTLTLPHARLKKVPKPVFKVIPVLIIPQKKKPKKKKAIYYASVGKKQGRSEAELCIILAFLLWAGSRGACIPLLCFFVILERRLGESHPNFKRKYNPGREASTMVGRRAAILHSVLIGQPKTLKYN